MVLNNQNNLQIQMADRHKKCTSSIAIREIQIKISLWLHVIPVNWLTFRTPLTISAGMEAEEKGTVVHYWSDCRLVPLR